MKVAVVGGGPSGLATLKHLKTAHLYFDIDPIDATLYEAEPSIGGTFVYRVYEDAELVSSKYLTAFSDFRFEPHKPDFVAPQDYVDYLESYALEFGLLPHIHCSTKVSRIRRKEDGQHLVTLLRQGVSTDKLFDAVAICSGLNVEPARPLVPGLYHTPTVLHSSEFHSRKQLLASRQDPTVVVMGIGETGMDLGHLAVTTPGVKSVIMCHHQGFFCAPKRVPEPTLLGFWSRCKRQPPKPIDASTASLFDTAYVHPYLQRGSLLWRYYTWSIRSLLFLATGTSRGYDQWVGGLSDERMNANGIFLCKSDRAMPYLSAPYRSGSLANRIRAAFCNMPIPNTCGRHIDLAPWPTHIDDDGFMHFEHTDRPESQKFQDVLLKPDVVLLATGYTQRFDFLDATYTTPQKANVRGVYHEDDVSVGFIGFVRPSIGAIPPLAELQAQLWVLRLVQSVSRQYGVAKADARLHSLDANALPPYELDYALHPRGNHDMYEEKLGVDHESYAYQLALDMGTAPTFTFMVRQGPTMLWTWAMGSNFNTKFRLVGPWKDRNRALAIMRGELYPVTKRFGGFVFFFLYTIVPFIAFGTLSMVLYAWDAIRGLFVGKREKARPSAT